MKKIITILIAVVAFVSLHAQTSREEARRVILEQGKNNGNGSQNPRDIILGGGNNGSYPNTYPGNYPYGSREEQIYKVNSEYDQRIQAVRNNPYLGTAEKNRTIRQLENERNRRMREINNQYGNGNGNNRYNKKYSKKNYDDKEDSYEGDNNNRNGNRWYKGKRNKKEHDDD